MTTLQIYQIGSVLVVISGVIGGFIGGYLKRKSSDTQDAVETIDLKDKAIQALRDEVAALTRRVNEQDEKIKHITEINNAYIRLFSGEPSRLEEYMKETNESLKSIDKKLNVGPAVVVQTQK